MYCLEKKNLFKEKKNRRERERNKEIVNEKLDLKKKMITEIMKWK